MGTFFQYFKNLWYYIRLCASVDVPNELTHTQILILLLEVLTAQRVCALSACNTQHGKCLVIGPLSMPYSNSKLCNIYTTRRRQLKEPVLVYAYTTSREQSYTIQRFHNVQPTSLRYSGM